VRAEHKDMDGLSFGMKHELLEWKRRLRSLLERTRVSIFHISESKRHEVGNLSSTQIHIRHVLARLRL
jgi:hypothetical protein